MKILKSKTWNDIQSSIKEDKDSIKDLEVKVITSYKEKRKLVERMCFDFSIKRVIYGRNGSGKTIFLCKTLLPQLSDFFVFCLPNEIDTLFNFVPKNRKCSIDKLINGDVVGNFTKKLNEINNSLIVIDNSHLLGRDIFKIVHILETFGYNYILAHTSHIQFPYENTSINIIHYIKEDYKVYSHHTSSPNILISNYTIKDSQKYE